MSRYIDADELMERFRAKRECPMDAIPNHGDTDASLMFLSMRNAYAQAVLTVKAMPTVDAVPVVRCRECKWCEYPATNSTKYGCRLFDRCVKSDWFCADGERKDNE